MKRKIPSPCREANPKTSIVQPVCNKNYTRFTAPWWNGAALPCNKNKQTVPALHAAFKPHPPLMSSVPLERHTFLVFLLTYFTHSCQFLKLIGPNILERTLFNAGNTGINEQNIQKYGNLCFNNEMIPRT
jgi:hypothetical protein